MMGDFSKLFNMSFTTKGKIGRLDFFVYLAVLVIAYVAAIILTPAFIDAFHVDFMVKLPIAWLASPISVKIVSIAIYTIIFLIILSNLSVKRLHDIELSGLWVLIGWILISLFTYDIISITLFGPTQSTLSILGLVNLILMAMFYFLLFYKK